jgi:hypothetical protein
VANLGLISATVRHAVLGGQAACLGAERRAGGVPEVWVGDGVVADNAVARTGA